MTSSDEFSLKEFFQLELSRIRLEMQRMNEKMDKLVTCDRFESGMHRVVKLEDAVNGRGGVDDRLNDLAGTIKVWSYIGGLIVGIIVLLVGAWLKGALGI